MKQILTKTILGAVIIAMGSVAYAGAGSKVKEAAAKVSSKFELTSQEARGIHQALENSGKCAMGSLDAAFHTTINAVGLVVNVAGETVDMAITKVVKSDNYGEYYAYSKGYLLALKQDSRSVSVCIHDSWLNDFLTVVTAPIRFPAAFVADLLTLLTESVK